ncbi:MAG: 2,3-bisphosphoglycerate-independent phosphoglycerate mutase, partial [Parcubacteria group bacterium CG_4_9_14_0_2_um_filter_41_8]
KVFVQEDFTEKNPGSFTPKKKIQNLRFVAMTDFGPDLGNMLTAYPSIDVDDTLPMVLKNKRQLYMAESEKYAHITYFFNGGYAEPVNHEDRLVITSPDVDSYDKAPAMATKEIANTVARALNEKKYDFIAVNIAAPDMVAHSGNFEAAKEAIKATDSGLGIIMSAVKQSGAILIVTADHGNIEEMKDMSLKEKDTEHSKNQVPFLIWAPNQQIPNLREEGVLGDVAPTIIQLFRLQKPQAMTGKSLIIP